MTSRNFCFISQNISLWDPNRIAELMGKSNKIRYIVYQFELYQPTSTIYVQGYAEFTVPLRVSAIKNYFLDNTVICEKRSVDRDQARHFCMCIGANCSCNNEYRFYKLRPDNINAGPFEFGRWDVRCFQSHDNMEIEVVKRKIDSGLSIRQISTEHKNLFCLKKKEIYEYLKLSLKDRTVKTELHIIWGPGDKRNFFSSKYSPESIYYLRRGSTTNLWFEEYDPVIHENIFIENFDGWINFDTLITMASDTPFFVSNKCSKLKFIAKRIFIMSESSPFMWYPKYKIDLMLRLIDSIRYIDYYNKIYEDTSYLNLYFEIMNI